MRLSTLGVVEKEFRDAAFQFYEDIKKANPGRQIVLAGHSPGGNLTQYVATKGVNVKCPGSHLVVLYLVQVVLHFYQGLFKYAIKPFCIEHYFFAIGRLHGMFTHRWHPTKRVRQLQQIIHLSYDLGVVPLERRHH